MCASHWVEKTYWRNESEGSLLSDVGSVRFRPCGAPWPYSDCLQWSGGRAYML